MTILAPHRSRPPAARSGPKAPSRPGDPQIIGLALGPPPGTSSITVVHRPARLGGAARLGAGLLLVIGLLLQRTVLTLLPWGPADLVTVLVAALGLYAGPTAGCVGGFAVGLGADVLSDHALGRLAAVLCVVGYLCGMLADDAVRRRWIGWLAIGGACVGTPLLFALTGAFVGDDRAAGVLLLTRCVAGLCYGLVLAPFAYWLMRRLLSPRVASRRKERRIERRLKPGRGRAAP